MPDIQIIVDHRKLQAIQRLLAGVPKALPQVVSRALNKSAQRARAESVRQLAKHINLKQKRIREDIHVRKATHSVWAAAVQVRGQTIPLREYAVSRIIADGQGYHRPKRGITYIIEKSRGRITNPTAFFARMDTGHVGVFDRKAGAGRLPIVELFGPSVGGAFAQAENLVARVTSDAYQHLEKNLDTQVELLLRKVLGVKGAAA